MRNLRQTPERQLDGRQSRAQQEIDELNQQIKVINTAVAETRTVLTNAKNLLATRDTALNDRKVTLDRQQEQVARLQNDPRSTQISLDIDDARLANEERLNLDSLTSFKADAAKAQAEVAQKRTEINTLRQESTSNKAQLQTFRTQVANFQRALTEITGRLQESALPADAREEMLLSLIAEESRQQAQLVALRDSISSLELAVDAATTAAALTTLQQNVRNKERAVKAAARKRDQHQPWLAYFTRLSRLVSSQQNDAISEFYKRVRSAHIGHSATAPFRIRFRRYRNSEPRVYD